MYRINISKGEAMNKLYLALICLTVTAFAVSSVEANNRRRGGRNCASGNCSRPAKTCKTGSCKTKCPACPEKVYTEPKETYCVVEKYCKEVPDVKIVPTTKFVEVECVSNVVKECCVREGKPCSPEAAAGMTRIENAPQHIQRAMEKTPAAIK